MPSSNPKQVILGAELARIHGISDNDHYYLGCVQDQMEPEFHAITSALIPADGVCVDIGANIGIKTFIMAQQAKNGIVLSIEAGRHVFEVLCMNIKNNQLENVLPVHAAVTDKTSTVHFVENSAWGHMMTDDDTMECTDVPGVTMDYLLDKHLKEYQRISFVKIDTEGHEYQILKNVTPVLTQWNPWIYFELNCLGLFALGDVNPKEMLKWVFANFNYVFRVEKNAINADSAFLRQVDSKEILTLLYENVVLNGTVDDFLVTNRKSALQEIHHLLLSPPYPSPTSLMTKEVQMLQQELQKTQILLDETRQSRSWRWSAPLRTIMRLLRKDCNR